MRAKKLIPGWSPVQHHRSGQKGSSVGTSQKIIAKRRKADKLARKARRVRGKR